MEENKQHVNEDIYSKVLRAGRRTYFFDVRSTKAGDYYLTISESKKFTNEDGTFYFKKHKKKQRPCCFFQSNSLKIVFSSWGFQGPRWPSATGQKL